MRRRLSRLLLEANERDPVAGARPGAAHAASPIDCLGLPEERLVRLAVEHRFGTIASSFRGVGDPLELRAIAWWGSALADIGCVAGLGGRDEGLMADAARFYLGVALFDHFVDRAPARTAALAQSLEPGRLRRKLERPDDAEACLHCTAPDLNLIVTLFDRALAGIGRRLHAEPTWRMGIADMLEEMYLSELSLSGDPLPAKTLPFTLVGHLAVRPAEAAPRAFFVMLSQLLGLWDDWQDLVADGWDRAPNAHLGTPSPGRLRGLGRGLWLTLMGAIPGHQLSERLAQALAATLESARPLPVVARRKTNALLLHMLAGRVPPLVSDWRPGAEARPAS